MNDRHDEAIAIVDASPEEVFEFLDTQDPRGRREVVTLREPPLRKSWEIGAPTRLLATGRYRMGVEIEGRDTRSRVRVWIDYDPPPLARWMGRRLGPRYARSCVRELRESVIARFEPPPAQATSPLAVGA